MKSLTVALPGREYDILIASGILTRTGAECRKVLPKTSRILLVTDSNVAPLYGKTVEESLTESGFTVRTVVIPAGEPSKNADNLVLLWNEAMRFGITRTDAVIALGGGVVGDLAGFAAATILRGVAFVQIPTTLLAQVDSSVGGKVAIDLEAGKNLAGAFWQPKLVLMDPLTLNTLPDVTFSDGMAEVIKYGCIWDSDFFRLLSRCGNRAGVMERIEEVLYTCCAIKAKVVEEDELDTGLRMILNFGHTLGHAYEKAYHYETYTHGQAVSAGMCLVARLGEQLGLTESGTETAIRRLTAAYGLPTDIPCSLEDYRSAIGLDKKGSGDGITVIFLKKLGETLPKKLAKKELLNLL